MIDIEQTVSNRFPSLSNRSAVVRNSTLTFLKKMAYQQSVNDFLGANADKFGFEFIDAVFDYFDFSYSVSARDKANIPAEGRVVIIANHPIGTLDGLALVKLVGEVRTDVKVLANDLLSSIEALREHVIPVDNMTGGSALRSYKDVRDALKKDQAVIVFPAGEVSRARPLGVKDCAWRPGFLHFARKAGAPLLPVHIGAKNSLLFYSASMVFKPLGTALLPHEMFNKRSRTIQFKVGALISPEALITDKMRDKVLVKRLRKHVYKLGKNKAPVFQTLKTIAHPESRSALQAELKAAELLGETRDGNRIYLVNYSTDSPVLREIGRLREVAFRRVGEGTGGKRDLDKYDAIYRHLVLWDRENLQIAGAYRIGEGKSILQGIGEEGFYTRSLYVFKPAFEPYLADCIELGRSFVSPAYWGKASLDYLWQGIGAYLARYPARYIIGPVSMSADYPRELSDMLVYYYRRYYAFKDDLAVANVPYQLSVDALEKNDAKFGDLDASAAFTELQQAFLAQGHRFPVLFKQYMSIFEDGGFASLVFSVDPDFGDCLDGLCMADVTALKPAKRKRYIPNALEVCG
ncbi:MAG TPA: GNAT family N-acyltransferase [Marinagarivorans sp.]